MTDNQLATRLASTQRAGKVTTEMLFEYADRLNRMNFVRCTDKPYFVGRRENSEGKIEAYLDRHA